jgi:hypothetical protein
MPYQQQYQQPQYQPPAYAQPPYDPNYPPPAVPKKDNSALVIVLALLLAVVVLAGAGLAIYLWRTNAAATPPPPVPAVNDCLVSNGKAANPTLTKTACGPNTFKVLKVQRGSVDTSICNGVPGVTNNYTFQWPVDPQINDYVLCLQQQPSQ